MNRGLLFALLLPIVMLAVMMGREEWYLAHGEVVDLPISGYDPRDLLAGNYLRFRVDYGVEPCGRSRPEMAMAGVCLRPDPSVLEGDVPGDCTLFVRGQCRGGRFLAGVERYYIPAEAARDLEARLREGRAAVRLVIGENGRARIEALLIDGQPWR